MDTQEIPSLWKELLPGIPDDVVLDEIATKMAGTDVNTLSFVSPRWRHEIRSRVVYDARLRRRSTETHVVLQLRGGSFEGLCLYSLSNHNLYQLPPVPNSPFSYQFIAMDGKVYVLGGGDSSTEMDFEISCRKVFVLDLAGQKQWKQCASMLQSRQAFVCGAIDGKIYVFGGLGIGFGVRPEGASEVYDPEVDAWFPIKRMRSLTTGHIVTPVGEELFVQNRYESTFKVYHPGKDEWRAVELTPHPANIFIFHGEFYSSTVSRNSSRIVVYDAQHSLTWTHRCFIRCAELGPVAGVRIFLQSILSVNDELLANVHWSRADNQTQGQCLLLSCGFGSRDKYVVWRKEPYSFVFGQFHRFMCPVHL